MYSQTNKAHPAVFISAATADFDDWRKILSEALHSSGFAVYAQDHRQTKYARDLCTKLIRDIDACDHVIHLAGLAYGEKAEIDSRNFQNNSAILRIAKEHNKQPMSWTQFEFHYARLTGKEIYSVVFDESLLKIIASEKDSGEIISQKQHRNNLEKGEHFDANPELPEPRSANSCNVKSTQEMFQQIIIIINQIADNVKMDKRVSEEDINNIHRKVLRNGFVSVLMLCVLGLIFLLTTYNSILVSRSINNISAEKISPTTATDFSQKSIDQLGLSSVHKNITNINLGNHGSETIRIFPVKNILVDYVLVDQTNPEPKSVDSEGRFKLAQIGGDVDEMVKIAQSWVERDPRNPLAWNRLGYASAQSARMLNFESDSAERLKRLSKAKLAIQESIQLAATNQLFADTIANSYANISWVENEMKDYNNSEASARIALRIDNHNESAWLNLVVSILNKYGKQTGVYLKVLRDANLALPNNVQIKELYALRLVDEFQTGISNTKESLSIFNEIERLGYTNLNVTLGKVFFFIGSKDRESARLIIDIAERQAKTTNQRILVNIIKDSMLTMGPNSRWLDQEPVEKVKTELEKYWKMSGDLVADPNVDPPILALARWYQAMIGEKDHALGMLSRVPKDSEYKGFEVLIRMLIATRIMENLNQQPDRKDLVVRLFDEVIEMYEAMGRLLPQYRPLPSLWQKILPQIFSENWAVVYSEASTSLLSAETALHKFHGNLFCAKAKLCLGDVKSSIRYFKLAATYSDLGQLPLEYATALLEDNHNSEAEVFIKHFLQKNPKDLSAINHLFISLERQNKHDEALSVLRDALSFSRGSERAAEIEEKLSNVLYEKSLNEMERTEKIFDGYTLLQPENYFERRMKIESDLSEAYAFAKTADDLLRIGNLELRNAYGLFGVHQNFTNTVTNVIRKFRSDQRFPQNSPWLNGLEAWTMYSEIDKGALISNTIDKNIIHEIRKKFAINGACKICGDWQIADWKMQSLLESNVSVVNSIYSTISEIGIVDNKELVRRYHIEAILFISEIEEADASKIIIPDGIGAADYRGFSGRNRINKLLLWHYRCYFGEFGYRPDLLSAYGWRHLSSIRDSDGDKFGALVAAQNAVLVEKINYVNHALVSKYQFQNWKPFSAFWSLNKAIYYFPWRETDKYVEFSKLATQYFLCILSILFVCLGLIRLWDAWLCPMIWWRRDLWNLIPQFANRRR